MEEAFDYRRLASDLLPESWTSCVQTEGFYGGIDRAYGQPFAERLPTSGESVDKRPCLELYRNSTLDMPPEHLVTDLCVPLHRRTAG